MAQYTKIIFAAVAYTIFAAGVVGCASTPDEEEMQASANTTNADAAAGDAPASGSNSSAEANAQVAVATAPKIPLENVPEIVEPPRVVESCKKEPYIKYEKKSRASIKKGWAATKAEKYGVGFKDTAEYKKWSKTHNAVFKKVSAACADLSGCAKKHKKKNKAKKCASQATAFRDWQGLAKTFASKVKSVERSQVDPLCSLKPSLSDPGQCFKQIAGNVKKACKSDECNDLSLCWESISFMDIAIRQAETSCRFARQKLSKCRGYSEQIGRRKAQLSRCAATQEKLNIIVLPAI